MKSIIIYLSLLLCACGSTYKPDKSLIISGKDTIEIAGHYSWKHLGSPCGGEGTYDTITGIFTYRFNQCHIDSIISVNVQDAIHYTNDTIYISEPLFIPIKTKKKHK